MSEPSDYQAWVVRAEEDYALCARRCGERYHCSMARLSMLSNVQSSISRHSWWLMVMLSPERMIWQPFMICVSRRRCQFP